MGEDKYGTSTWPTWRTPVSVGLIGLGNNFINVSGKTAGTTRGTSFISKYLSSTKWGAKPTPKGLFKIMPKRVLGMSLRSPVLGRLVGRAVPIAGWVLLASDIVNYFYTGYKEIKNGALLDSNYYRSPGINKALRYGERE